MSPSLPELWILHRKYHKNELKEREINDSDLWQEKALEVMSPTSFGKWTYRC